jgi:hypothetical protein
MASVLEGCGFEEFAGGNVDSGRPEMSSRESWETFNTGLESKLNKVL